MLFSCWVSKATSLRTIESLQMQTNLRNLAECYRDEPKEQITNRSQAVLCFQTKAPKQSKAKPIFTAARGRGARVKTASQSISRVSPGCLKKGRSPQPERRQKPTECNTIGLFWGYCYIRHCLTMATFAARLLRPLPWARSNRSPSHSSIGAS